MVSRRRCDARLDHRHGIAQARFPCRLAVPRWRQAASQAPQRRIVSATYRHYGTSSPRGKQVSNSAHIAGNQCVAFVTRERSQIEGFLNPSLFALATRFGALLESCLRGHCCGNVSAFAVTAPGARRASLTTGVGVARLRATRLSTRAARACLDRCSARRRNCPTTSISGGFSSLHSCELLCEEPHLGTNPGAGQRPLLHRGVA
jgi:hypothetical protein